VKTALVATHSLVGLDPPNGDPPALLFVAKAIAINLGCFFSAHIDIVVGHNRHDIR
jgi:hypothetical protein